MVLTFHNSLHYLSFFYLLTFISLKQTGDVADVLFYVPYGIPKSKKNLSHRDCAKNSPKQEILKSSPTISKSNQNKLIIPQCWTRIYIPGYIIAKQYL